MEKINKIYIADLGLKTVNINILVNLSEKIEVINTNTVIGNSKKIFSDEWINAVNQKTLILHSLIQNNCVPIIMLDSDTIVVEDFSSVIDQNYDIQICKRSKPQYRKDNFILYYIASFFIANNYKSIIFLNAWIKRLEERIKLNFIPPHETPALVEILQDNMDLKIGILDENEICCDNNYIIDKTKIIHAKSRNPGDSISIFRLTNINNLPIKKIAYLFENKFEFIQFLFVFIIKKLFPIHIIKKLIKIFLQRNK